MNTERENELRRMYERGIEYDEYIHLPGKEQCLIYCWVGESIAQGFKDGLNKPLNKTAEKLKKWVNEIIRSAYEAG